MPRIYPGLVHRRSLALTGAVLLSFFVISEGALAARTVLWDGISERFRDEPSRVGYPGGPRFPELLGTTLTISSISWQDWGAGRSRGRGRADLCPNMADCQRSGVKLVASRLARQAEGSNVNIYARLRIRFLKDLSAADRTVTLCVYAEVCPENF